MKTLIVEDDFISRRILIQILSPYGMCDIAIDGKEALQAFRLALDESSPYDLVCMDIMMPELNGQEALKLIRALERERGIAESKGVTVVMASAKDEPRDVVEAMYLGGATGYLVKPVTRPKMLQELRGLGLLD